MDLDPLQTQLNLDQRNSDNNCLVLNVYNLFLIQEPNEGNTVDSLDRKTVLDEVQH